jgi:ribosomal protein L37AE/L43A
VNSRKTHACPKCGRTLQQSGELSVEAVSVPTFQCDECLMTIDFSGETMEVALTFAVDAAGNAFDPADPEGKLRL